MQWRLQTGGRSTAINNLPSPISETIVSDGYALMVITDLALVKSDSQVLA
jgi:hypothetical protein